MARRPLAAPTGDEHEEVIAWYRRALAEPPVFPWTGRRWEPVRIGPTWQTDGRRWLLPERTLGWDVLGWCGTELQHGRGRPWRFTLEQARFLLWWYALDDLGRWLFRHFVLQRLKGWGKDPIGACLCAVEAFGPCRLGDLVAGQPVAIDEPNAWVQTAAVSLEQTKNTMRLFPSLFSAEAKAFYAIQVGKEMVHGLADTRLIQAVTSSPTTLEGARSTFTLGNETQHWLASNDGHDMAAVIDRNAGKSEGGRARTGNITNAYEPGEDSVAQQDREAWELAEAGQSLTTGILYDSLEAHPEAPLAVARLDDETADEHAARTRANIREAVLSVRGDSVWLDPDTIVESILDTRNPPSRSRRFWYNQITATEDAWLAPAEYDACYDGTKIVAGGDLVTLGFDGSTTDDHSALILCHVDLDHLVEVKVWEPQKATGEVDRADIDRTVRAAFETYDVVGFYSDLHPWESYVDRWAEDLGADLLAKATVRHPIAYDLRNRTQTATAGYERLHEAIVDRVVTHDGAAKMRLHFHHARRAPNKFGIAVRKEHRESARKIDSVPAAMLARLARADYLALPPSRRRRRQRTGKVW